MPEVKPSEVQSFASIKVVGVGGAGGSAINRMKDAGLGGVQFIAMNTDAQALHNSKADVKIHLGHSTTNGLGAGADPTVGEAAANESRDEIRQSIEGADMIFVTIGAGGGTGSGAGHVVADRADDLPSQQQRAPSPRLGLGRQRPARQHADHRTRTAHRQSSGRHRAAVGL